MDPAAAVCMHVWLGWSCPSLQCVCFPWCAVGLWLAFTWLISPAAVLTADWATKTNPKFRRSEGITTYVSKQFGALCWQLLFVNFAAAFWPLPGEAWEARGDRWAQPELLEPCPALGVESGGGGRERPPPTPGSPGCGVHSLRRVEKLPEMARVPYPLAL